jgi:ankyrin repeat protein
MPVDLGDRRVSRYEATTGRSAAYVIVDVSDDAMHCMQLAPMLERKLAEGFSPDSGNVMSHIAASKGESNRLLLRQEKSIHYNHELLAQSLREGARRCDSVAQATDIILSEHYASQPEPECVRIERVGSEKLAHTYVRVILRDGSTVVHDHWINPEAFLQEDGRFGMADDLSVLATWSPRDQVTRRWDDLKQQASAAGEIRIDEFPANIQQSIHAGDFAGGLMGYATRVVKNNLAPQRTESDCLLTPEQEAQRGLQPNEKIAYHHEGHYYSNDVVAESSIRRVDDPAFPELHLGQARWEYAVEAAFWRRDLQGFTQLLKRDDVCQWFPERHGNLCLRLMSAELNLLPQAQDLGFISVLLAEAIDAATETQMKLMMRARYIEKALTNCDVQALEQWLIPESIAATGDQGATWLMLACQALNTHGVKYLLKAGAEFHASQGRDNCLVLAIEAGGTEMVNLLVKRGASALGPKVTQVMPWQYALQLLRDSPDTGVDRRAVADRMYKHTLAEALALQPADRALLLETLSAGIDGEALRNRLALAIWRSDLEQACASGNVKEIGQLLASDVVNADMAMRKNAGIAASALLCQVIERAPVDPAVVDALLAGGVDVNWNARDGKTPLLVACSTAEIDIVHKLLKAGAEINDSFWDRHSALGHACERGLPDLVRLLLKGGASPTLRDPTGYTPAETAMESLEFSPGDDAAHANWVKVVELVKEFAV